MMKPVEPAASRPQRWSLEAYQRKLSEYKERMREHQMERAWVDKQLDEISSLNSVRKPSADKDSPELPPQQVEEPLV